MVLEYQNKFDNIFSNTNAELTSLRHIFTFNWNLSFKLKESEYGFVETKLHVGEKTCHKRTVV